MTHLRLATRRSPLALAQAELVRERLSAVGTSSELVETDTTGDRRAASSLTDLGGQGAFALEVQQLVLDGRADVAVHSAKDLPSTTPAGLVLSSVPERRDAADVLVGRSLAGLGPGATVATGSPRRRALLLERRPDLRVVELRGNMATRLAAAGRGGVDAVVAAAAALDRLGWLDRVAERLDPSWFIPQVGQGALALESRADDESTRDVLISISLDDALVALVAERSFLRELGAGCSVPAAAYAERAGSAIRLIAMMASVDGSRVVRADCSGDDGEALGVSVARYLRDDCDGASLEGWAS